MENYFKIYIKIIILLVISSSYSCLYGLSLNQYLTEVAEHNDDYKSTELLSKAGFSRSEEGFLTVSPYLTSRALYLNDSQPTLSTALDGVKTINERINVGVSKKFTTGSSLKLEYDNLYTDISNGNNSLISNNNSWDVKPILSFEQPLLRDWLGKETQALIDLKNSAALIQGHSSIFTNQKTLAEAESVYWDLATVVENIIIKEDSVERGDKLVQWAQKRLKLGLADTSDYLQAKAAYEQRKFELESTIDLQKAKARLFNAFRSIQSDTIPDKFETYDNIDKASIKAMKPKNYELPPGIREDLHAAYESLINAQARAEISTQNIKPDLNFNLKYNPTGRDPVYKNSVNEAVKAKRNTYSLGLNFSMPLDRSLIKELNGAYKAESYAAELAYARKKFEVTNEWQRLAEQFDLFAKQLSISKSLVATQAEKLKDGEKLLKNGRTTTFEVLQFEQDFFNAQSQYLDTKNKLLKLHTLMKLFN